MEAERWPGREARKEQRGAVSQNPCRRHCANQSRSFQEALGRIGGGGVTSPAISWKRIWVKTEKWDDCMKRAILEDSLSPSPALLIPTPPL